MKKIYLIGVLILLVAIGFIANAQGGKFFKFLGNPTVYKAYSSSEEFLTDGGDWNAIQNFDEPKFGSVSVTSEYYATTTIINSTNVDTLIKAGQGTFGSVIITTAGNTSFNLFDATTTDVTKRTGNVATSTITLASFPPSETVGVYTFDVVFTRGLYFDVMAGTLGTSTITFR
jgi:hypothetical protein